jgi:hypothetical protein
MLPQHPESASIKIPFSDKNLLTSSKKWEHCETGFTFWSERGILIEADSGSLISKSILNQN